MGADQTLGLDLVSFVDMSFVDMSHAVGPPFPSSPLL